MMVWGASCLKTTPFPSRMVPPLLVSGSDPTNKMKKADVVLKQEVDYCTTGCVLYLYIHTVSAVTIQRSPLTHERVDSLHERVDSPCA